MLSKDAAHLERFFNSETHLDARHLETEVVEVCFAAQTSQEQRPYVLFMTGSHDALFSFNPV